MAIKKVTKLNFVIIIGSISILTVVTFAMAFSPFNPINRELSVGAIAIALLLVGLLMIHRLFTEKINNKESMLLVSAERKLNEEIRKLRHRHRNHLQIITGYLEMNLTEEAIAYIERTEGKVQDNDVSMGVPELEFVIFEQMRKAKLLDISFDLNLKWVLLRAEHIPQISRVIRDIMGSCFEQIAYAKENQLGRSTISQGICISSGLRLHTIGDHVEKRWFVEMILTEIPIAVSRALINHLNATIKESDAYDFGISHKLSTYSLVIELSECVRAL